MIIFRNDFVYLCGVDICLCCRCDVSGFVVVGLMLICAVFIKLLKLLIFHMFWFEIDVSGLLNIIFEFGVYFGFDVSVFI